PSTALRASLRRSVHRHQRAACRRTAPGRRQTGRPGLHPQVRLAGETAASLVRRRQSLLVDGTMSVLRLATRTDLDLLAASLAYLPPPNPSSIVAEIGGPTRPGDLRAFGRCDLERGRPDLFAGRSE